MKLKLLCCAAIGLASCAQPKETSLVSYEDTDLEMPANEEVATVFYATESNAPAFSPPPPYSQKLIRQATLIFEVGDINHAYDSIKLVVESFHGYTSNEEKINAGEQAEQHMDIRVEEKFFDDVIDRILFLAKNVESRNISVQDVTAEYSDINARLKTKKDVEMRYVEILRQARTVKDMLAIEEQLGIVREEIESMEARMKVMTNQIAYCSIRIEFSDVITTSVPGFSSKFLLSLQTGWNSLMKLFLGMTALWPFLVGGSLAWIAIIRLIKRRRRSVHNTTVV